MRPKLIALIAVSAIALVGCSAGESSVEPTATVTVTATPEPEVVTQELPIQPNDAAEEMFADFAETRAIAHDAKKPNRAKVIDALKKFCEDGKPFKVSTSAALNENLAADAKRFQCQNFETK